MPLNRGGRELLLVRFEEYVTQTEKAWLVVFRSGARPRDRRCACCSNGSSATRSAPGASWTGASVEPEEVWLPKSQCVGFDRQLRTVWVKRWLVEKRALEHEPGASFAVAVYAALLEAEPAPQRRIRVIGRKEGT